MTAELRDTLVDVPGVYTVQPSDISHRGSKSILACEIVNVRVYQSVYMPVRTHAVEPAPDADEFADYRVRFDGERARHAAHLRVVRQADLDGDPRLDHAGHHVTA